MVIKQQKDSPGLPVQTPIPMIRSEIANSTEYSLYGFSWILVKKKFPPDRQRKIHTENYPINDKNIHSDISINEHNDRYIHYSFVTNLAMFK